MLNNTNLEKKAYVIISMTANPAQQDALLEYKNVAKKVRDENGARVLLKKDVHKDVIGNFNGESIRILEFPSENNIHNWLNDPRYIKVKPLRDKAFSYLSLTILSNT
ncbi:DUF1330 domain-containing protein [Priestia aryabhattai]|uniref:DUF1330 domain-containing protein n=1 Tax=Priestia megaterium TaxID=1404 RepID=UPI0039B94796